MSKITLGNVKFNKRDLDAELRNVVNKAFATNGVSKSHVDAIKRLVANSLRNSNFYRNFTTGSDLVVGLGVPAGEEKIRIEAVINAIVDNLKIGLNKRGTNQYIGSISIYVELNEAVYSYITNIREANITTEKGENIPWLKWVIIDGDTIIIKNYDVMQNIGLGRSGGGIMVKSSNVSYRIPTEYSGTLEDNWITRAIEDAETSLNKIIENIFKDLLS